MSDIHCLPNQLIQLTVTNRSHPALLKGRGYLEGYLPPLPLITTLAMDEEGETVDSLEDFETKWNKKQKGKSASEVGGVQWDDEAALKQQRAVVWQFAKKLGKNLFAAHDLTKIAFPVVLFESDSYLQRVASQIRYHPLYLTKAAEATTPVERFKWVVVYVVAGLHLLETQFRKPFNPILGETYHCTYPDGSELFMEQSSHHPPISCWECHGLDDSYVYAGWSEFSAKFHGNNITAEVVGPQNIYFKDGTYITFSIPSVLVSGIAWGSRVMNYTGTFTVTDPKNNLSVKLTLNPKEGGMFSRKKCPPNTIRGDIMQADAKGKETRVSSVDGSWLGELSFDEEVYWRLEEQRKLSCAPTPGPGELLSDSRYRLDTYYLGQGDNDKAEEWKSKMEEDQRRDRKLRAGQKAAYERMAARAKARSIG